MLARLKAWRRDEARRQGLPAYVILHDATLTAMATRLPQTLGELASIPGIGEKRLARYGEGLLEAVGKSSER